MFQPKKIKSIAQRLVLLLSMIMMQFLVAQTLSSPYLGLRVQNLPAHVRAHMPDNVAKNQGVIVDWLDDISPAADDGIQRYDVLLSIDNTVIANTTNFIQTIQQKKVGQKIKIKLVRQGEVLTIPVMTSEPPLGQRMTPPPKQANLYQPNREPLQKPLNQPSAAKQFQPLTRPLNIAGKPAFPMRKKMKVEKHAWGKERNIWPDFYTDSTSDIWDNMINAPFKMGRMPGGWRAPSMSMPDPVTIGDAVTNQMPPMAEEMGNMMDISD